MSYEYTSITASELKKQNNSDLNVNKSNTGFYHYTTIESANSILESEFFFASLISETNDNNEKERYKNTDTKTYILCFCNSDSERIPMWYLYSGISGKGIRIGLTQSKMKELIRSIDTVYPVIDNKPNTQEKLIINKDFTLSTGWVYYSQYPSRERIRYKSKNYKITDSISKFEDNNDFIKNYEWYYENEFRIIIKLKSNTYAPRKIAIRINPFIFKLKVAPENSNKSALLCMNGFKKYLENKIEDSELKISMNLINRDFNSILEYIEQIKDKTIIEKIYSIVNDKRNGNYKKGQSKE